MTNKKLLEMYIAKSGYKKEFIAKRIGLNYRTFKNRVDNVCEFKAGEIERLCNLLNINDLEERHRIFFASEVD